MKENGVSNFSDRFPGIKAALCHDWLTGMRGGERVLEVLCRAFPDARIYTLIHNPGAVSDIINSHNITTSWLQGIPGIMRCYRSFLPLFPFAVERLAPPDVDLLISASHCIAKGLRTRPGAKHLCYCFTPMRYAWLFRNEYFGKSALKTILAMPMLAALRDWDRKASARVDRFVAISRHVRKRIKDFYGRDSDVVYPPVNTEYWTPGGNAPGNFDLIVSALVPYKRIDLAIRAYSKLGYPLRVVGIGSDMKKLRSAAGTNIEFLGRRTDAELLDLYRDCRMLVFPGEEDFGIVPLEAQACGRPVVAYAKGGALETVKEGVSGVFFKEQTEDCLLDAVAECAGMKWDARAISAGAQQFGVENFARGLADSIEKCLKTGHTNADFAHTQPKV